MASSFSMHPSLTSELIKKIDYSGNRFEFSYTDDNEDFPIDLDDINGTESSFIACLRDPRCIWYPETSNLIIRKNCTISNPAVLFGPSGIAPKDAVIGVAIIWISSKSRASPLNLSINLRMFWRRILKSRNFCRMPI